MTAVMDKGKVVAIGRNKDLKHNYGGGFKLKIYKHKHTHNEHIDINHLQNNHNSIEIDRESSLDALDN